MDIYLFSIILLAGLAIFDLIVGVSNDAVNFLNSSIGSRVAPRHVIMIIASLGMLAGVTFSSGMMEVARKGIFHPQYFIMPELIMIFLAVMLTDIILLDMFNTLGLPTSTTVSIVFELLGAAVAVSLIKIHISGSGLSSLVTYINTGKALAIISGILMSVVIAFFFGAVIQFITRLIFTFDYHQRLKRYGGIWGGIALSAITYFILIKGAKGASFITPDMLKWIKGHTLLILGINFLSFAIIFQLLVTFTKINILKPIVLIGTFALAMAFAANDLVNFIGVPLAGLSAYKVAHGAGDSLTASMEALQAPVKSNTYLLLIAGIIMVITLWVSKKARTVTKTEVNLGRQDEGIEQFGSSPMARVIVLAVLTQFNMIKKIIPLSLRKAMSTRLNPNTGPGETSRHGKEVPSFDLLRASVNLMVASAVVSFATSLKLPLSTTYVTFMVAMGTSLSDLAWGRESAVYRVTGVITVIGGWFFTAFVAFSISMIFAFIVYFFKLPAIICLILLAIFVIYHSYQMHFKREKDDALIEAFSLKNIHDADAAIAISADQFNLFLREMKKNLAMCLESTFSENRAVLKSIRRETHKIQKWTNIIIANFFKTLFLLDKRDIQKSHAYSRIVRSLQELSESHRDIILRAYNHVNNHHSGLLDAQKKEIENVMQILIAQIAQCCDMLESKKITNHENVCRKRDELASLVSTYDHHQILRIHHSESKTRLSILYYGFMSNCIKISRETENLMDILLASANCRTNRDLDT